MVEKVPALTHRQMLKVNKDNEQAAAVMRLVYVNDKMPGIARKKKGKYYQYIAGSKAVKDETTLDRIKKLVIPPAWTNVWICAKANGHIQCTGLDLRKRKQYRYHSLWNLLRKETKFHHLYEFGLVLPELRKRIAKDLAQPELNQSKVLAAVLSVMEQTYIRIGSNEYEKIYGSYGLTTMKDKHTSINGSKVDFCFVGKKGVEQKITLHNKRLARIVKECRDVPGKDLFQYYDSDGVRKPIDGTMVNNYIKEATGDNFSAKDFRTWAGSLHALKALHDIGAGETDAEIKKNLVAALDIVSEKLGNTRTVCKKYYVHPGVLSLYEEKKLQRYINELDKPFKTKNTTDLAKEEVVLLKILKKL
ncbi:MAG: DNA topoisomerase IB [Chitinophagaceae bacterium]|nr:MAG: DNA topoisomerase IB [Chitinophagaceae bacterium]